MKVRLGLLREYIKEAVAMSHMTAPAAPTDPDATVPGHLPSELPKSAALEEQGWVPGRWFPNGYEAEPYDASRLGDPSGSPSSDDLDETDARMEGDGKGNGMPDPATGDDEDDVAEHLRGDDEKLSLGSPPEEKPEKGWYGEAWLEREIRSFMLQEGVLTEYPAGAGAVDPTKPPKGFYSDFDADRDHGSPDSIHGFWYASPGRTPGEDGDPRRQADPYAQMGFHPPKGADDPTATHPATTGEEGFAALRVPEIPELTSGSDTSTTLGANAKPNKGDVGSEGEPEEGEEEAGTDADSAVGDQGESEEQE